MNTASLRTISYSDYNISLLDEVVPLNGASHADVVRYTIDIPMRYAECFAVLTNGDKVPLANKRQFVGWSGRDGKHSLLFETDDCRIEACIDPDDQVGCQSPGNIACVEQQLISSKPQNDHRRFIATDGNVLSFPVA